ncbi:MAG: histidine phosphatase family protein [Dyella sp.]
MPTVRFIRHGESTANAGAASQAPATIALTALGEQQARVLATSFIEAPELIVSSPFLRARQTAAPTAARYSETPLEIWPIEEFTYLAPERCINTTAEQRRPWVAGYWHRNDPRVADGNGAECFADFIARVTHALHRLAARPERFIAVFGHGQFMKAMRWLIESPPRHIDSAAMQAFRTADLAGWIDNGNGYVARLHQQHWRLD